MYSQPLVDRQDISEGRKHVAWRGTDVEVVEVHVSTGVVIAIRCPKMSQQRVLDERAQPYPSWRSLWPQEELECTRSRPSWNHRWLNHRNDQLVLCTIVRRVLTVEKII